MHEEIYSNIKFNCKQGQQKKWMNYVHTNYMENNNPNGILAVIAPKRFGKTKFTVSVIAERYLLAIRNHKDMLVLIPNRDHMFELMNAVIQCLKEEYHFKESTFQVNTWAGTVEGEHNDERIIFRDDAFPLLANDIDSIVVDDAHLVFNGYLWKAYEWAYRNMKQVVFIGCEHKKTGYLEKDVWSMIQNSPATQTIIIGRDKTKQSPVTLNELMERSRKENAGRTEDVIRKMMHPQDESFSFSNNQGNISFGDGNRQHI